MLALNLYSFQNNIASKNNVSFKSGSYPSKMTLEYLEHLKPKKRNFSSIDTSKIQDIFKGLKSFQGLNVSDLFTKDFSFSSILIQRGCIHQCNHCGANSPKGIQMMKWADYMNLVDDITDLSKRLHFNPFDNVNHKIISLYHDSDPMIYNGKGLDGIGHNIYDAAKYLYEKTGKQTIIQTAGWQSAFSQNAAESFVKDSSPLYYFGISIHPFHKYMERSIQAEIAGNHKDAEKWRNLYVDMMANVIKTTLPLKEKVRYGVILEYAKPKVKFKDSRRQEYYDKKAAKKLYNDILQRANIEDVKIFAQNRGISKFGRGSVLVEKINNILNLSIGFWRKNHNSISINPDGKILSNPYKKGKVFFEPTPVLDSNKNPLSLKFAPQEEHK